MRVAFVLPETVRHGRTDARARVERIAELLAGRGHEVVVATTPWWASGDLREFESDAGVAYRAVAGGPGRSFALRLPFALRRFSPDVVHAAGAAGSRALAASAGARLAGAPLVVEWYDEPIDGVSARAATTGDLLVAPSRMIRTRLREAGADGTDVRVVPDPVDLGLVESVEPDAEAGGDVVYARRLDDGANLRSFLLGLAELRGYDFSATVIGDGPERDRYERQASDLGIADRVQFVGERSREERIAAYRGAHVFVHTAHRSAFPTELLWATTAGCVGIVEYHADSAAHELVEGRERGFRTTSEEELAAAIREAGDQETLAFDDSLAGYGSDPVLERYLACYRDLNDDPGAL
jgi:glycosyltransferase involved in cell wall biosynthesis